MSLSDRIRLAQALRDSISECPESLPLTEADRSELDRRLDAYYRDPAGRCGLILRCCMPAPAG
jgi:putative addiction module component (TIGR02574 family)